jgi:hypothetical protein
MGKRFWVGRGCFFSGGVGGGEEELQDTTAETFSQDDASSKQFGHEFQTEFQTVWNSRPALELAS